MSAIRPREIRQHPNKLDLISDVLSTSPDVYKHESMIVELASKLGLTGEVQKGRMLALLAEAAAGKRDWELAVAYTEKGLEIVKAIDQRRDRQAQKAAPAARHLKAETSEQAGLRGAICAAALRVGGSGADEWADVERKLALLGRTAEVCSADLLSRILERWAEVEGGRIKLDEAAKRRRIEGVAAPLLKQAQHDVSRARLSPGGEGRSDGVWSRRHARESTAHQVSISRVGSRSCVQYYGRCRQYVRPPTRVWQQSAVYAGRPR